MESKDHQRKTRKVKGYNNCNSKWITYAIGCIDCDLWYIGKTFTSFKASYSTHRSNLNARIRDGIIQDPATATQSEIHLYNHFAQNHTDISSLKWFIIDQIGKSTKDPAGNLLKWEHAYIDYLDVKHPNGLNTID